MRLTVSSPFVPSCVIKMPLLWSGSSNRNSFLETCLTLALNSLCSWPWPWPSPSECEMTGVCQHVLFIACWQSYSSLDGKQALQPWALQREFFQEVTKPLRELINQVCVRQLLLPCPQAAGGENHWQWIVSHKVRNPVSYGEQCFLKLFPLLDPFFQWNFPQPQVYWYVK